MIPKSGKLENFIDPGGQVPVYQTQNMATPVQKPIEFIKYADIPEFAKIEIHLDEKGNPKVSNAKFKCSIGCFLGITVQVFNADGVEIKVNSSMWEVDTPCISHIIQGPNKSKTLFTKPGSLIGVAGPSNEFGWTSPGEFKIAVRAQTLQAGFHFKRESNGPSEALNTLGIFCGHASITVSAPIVQDLFLESQETSEVRKHTDGTTWLEFGHVKLQSCLSMTGFSGTVGFAQYLNTSTVRKSAEGIYQTLQNTQDFKTISYIGQEHLSNASDQKVLVKDYTPGVRLNPSSSDVRNWTRYTTTNSFKTYVTFQPDIYAPGITKTFIVKYNPLEINWGWSATALFKDTLGWILENSESNNLITTTDNSQWEVLLYDSFYTVNDGDWIL